MVIHILNDGSTTNDITDHVVKVSEAITLYDKIRKHNRRLLLSDESKNSTARKNKCSAAS